MNMRSQTVAGVSAIAALVAALALMGVIAIVPFWRSSGLEQTITQQQSQLAQLRKQIARGGELRKENSALAAPGQETKLLLEGETTGIAGANLQKLTSALVLEHGGTASSFQIMPAKVDGNLMRIPMSLSISVGLDALRDILHRLETGTPLIFIDEIVIRPDLQGWRQAGPNFIGPFDVTLQVSGFALNKGGS